MSMSTFHTLWLAIDVLFLICSLLWAIRIRPRIATYPALLQLASIIIVQTAIASRAWLPGGPTFFPPGIWHFLGSVTFSSTLLPLMQLFSVLRPKNASRNVEA